MLRCEYTRHTTAGDGQCGDLAIATTDRTVRLVQITDVIDLTEEQARALRDALNDILGDDK